MTGFSSGAMLVWNLACNEGTLFAGFAPISGTFWAPIPARCPNLPVSLIHFHGISDPVVPIVGRAIADSGQGDVMDALAMFAKEGDFGPEKRVPAEGLDCKRRENPEGKILEFCSHPGGHYYKASFVRRAWKEMHIGHR